MGCGYGKMSFSQVAASSMDIAEKRPIYLQVFMAWGVDLLIGVP